VTPRPLFIANFKMNLVEADVTTYLNRFKPLVFESEGRDIVIAPPYTSIKTAALLTERARVSVGAQDVHPEAEGAFTGCVSARMLRAAGCRYVIVGHSERRRQFAEDDALVRAKVAAAMAERLIPVVCVGETADQRRRGRPRDVVEAQLRSALAGIEVRADARLDVAYEPVWAIGTGEAATGEQAEEMHLHVRRLLEAAYPGPVGAGIRILYGGSVSPDNADDLMSRREVNGLLVGGASLDPEKFAAICNVPLRASDAVEGGTGGPAAPA
jgi:triosephosphate isomerase